MRACQVVGSTARGSSMECDIIVATWRAARGAADMELQGTRMWLQQGTASKARVGVYGHLKHEAQEPMGGTAPVPSDLRHGAGLLMGLRLPAQESIQLPRPWSKHSGHHVEGAIRSSRACHVEDHSDPNSCQLGAQAHSRAPTAQDPVSGAAKIGARERRLCQGRPRMPQTRGRPGGGRASRVVEDQRPAEGVLDEVERQFEAGFG